MTLLDFFDFKDLASKLKNFELSTDNQKIHWNSIKTISICSENPNSFEFQTEYGSVKHTVDLFYRSRYSTPCPADLDLTQLRDERPTIPRPKYLDLVSLCKSNIIPRAHQPFYIFLPHD